jgi:Zn-dependent hydrolases, including glyoxylases
MAAGTTVSILPCGAMTADLTWLLLAPGRAIRNRQNKHLPAEWVDVPTHCVLVDTPDGKLLWDTSCPRDWETRWAPTGLQDFFPYEKVSDDEYLDSRLKQIGVAPGDIDYVVLSHLHFDHAGNVQAFKETNARLVCSAKEKEWAFGFDGPFNGAHLKADYQGLDFETVDGDAEFLPGVSFIQTPGHTPGSMSMRVDLPETGTMIFTADAVYMGASYGPPAVPRPSSTTWSSSTRAWRSCAASRPRRTRPWCSGTTRTRSRSCAPRRRGATGDRGLGTDLTEETIFTWGAPPLKFGAGAVDEIGFEMAQFGARRVLILTDPQINALGIPARIAESLTSTGSPRRSSTGCTSSPPTTAWTRRQATPASRARGTASSRWAAARPSTRPRRSTC